jgi:hypothetical protein
MASGTKRSGESRGDVIRYRAAKGLGAVPLVGMAAIAIGVGRGQVVVIADMAGSARCGDVRAGQRPASDGVIKVGGAPAQGGVAIRTISQSEGCTGGGVSGIICLLPSGKVAAGGAASRRSDLQIVVVADVAIGAGRNLSAIRNKLVQILQREPGRIVAPCGGPICRGVA